MFVDYDYTWLLQIPTQGAHLVITNAWNVVASAQQGWGSVQNSEAKTNVMAMTGRQGGSAEWASQ